MLIKLLQEHFYAVQIGVAAVLVGGMLFFARSSGSDSSFEVREADLKKDFAPPGSEEAKKLAEAKIQKPQGPLRLSGISLSGKPHEILGVRENASPDDVQKAYRELMKRYHPDRVGRPGSREWTDAQKIAEAINHAKDVLLKARSRS